MLSLRVASGRFPQRMTRLFSSLTDLDVLSTGGPSDRQAASSSSVPPRVDGFFKGGWIINNVLVKGPVLLLNEASFIVDSAAAAAVSTDCFELLVNMDPLPEIVLFGSGASNVLPPKEVFEFLQRYRIPFENSDSLHASATFNMLCQEGRRVGALLLPIDTLKSL